MAKKYAQENQLKLAGGGGEDITTTNEILKLLQTEEDFEKLCHGKGKQDDITVVSAWISSTTTNSIKDTC